MIKYKNTITYSGKLSYDQNAEYILLSPINTINISTILNQIYYSNNNYIEIKITNGCKTLFNEKGNLLKRKNDEFRIYDWHVNGNCLEDVLFNWTDNDLEIAIFAEILEVLNKQGQGEVFSHGKEQTTNCVK